MTADEAESIEGHGGGDLLRRLILGALALYLAPAILLVMLIGGLGILCHAVVRRLGRAREAGVAGRRRDRAARAVTAPHFGAASRSSSLRR